MKILAKYNTAYRPNTELLTIDIEVVRGSSVVNGSINLDRYDPDFDYFETNMMLAFDVRDFDLEDAYESNVKGSSSKYYIYTKIDPVGQRLKVFVKLRISDHVAPDRKKNGERISQKELSVDHVKEEAAKYAREHFNQRRGYKPRLIDIIFDDEHFTSYEKALCEIEDRLDEFDPPNKYEE